MVSRRSLLLGGGAAVVTATAVGRDRLPYRVRDTLGLADDPVVALPTGPTGPLVKGALPGGAGFGISYPHGSTDKDSLPVCLVLHGRGGDHTDAFGSHGLDRFLAEVVRTGTPPFVLAAVDGGPDSYWHRRSDGRDPEANVTQLLAELQRRGHPVNRVAISGWSMGGYGALLMAARLGSSTVTAVVADSPALFRRYADARPGAFDDEADYRAHDVFAATGPLSNLSVRLSCGQDDPFFTPTAQLAAALPRAEASFGQGSHNVAFWRSTGAADLRFIGRALSNPAPP